MKPDDLASIAATALAAEGADVLFGLPGGGNDLELVAAAEAAGLRFVLAHSELGATYMAAAYAELTTLPTACVVTRGPGAASAVNGAAQALLDRQPMLLFSDAVSAADAPRVTHQLLDQRAMFSPVTKWSGTLSSVDPAATVRCAIDLARAPAPGPVHLDLDPAGPPTALPQPPDASASRHGDPAEARAALARARRPVILLGRGAHAAAAAVRELVRGTGIPVLPTYKAKGAIPDSWPNVAGVLTGATIESRVIEAADVVLAIGLDTVELIPTPWPYTAPVVSIAPWRDDAAYLTPAVEVVGPLDELLADLGGLPDTWSPWYAREQRTHATTRLTAGASPDRLGPTALVRAVRAAAPPGSAATVDSGAHMLPVMALWDAEEPGGLLISSGLATMGFGLPAAIASAMARPDRRTFCFVGDGGLGMVLAELETVARLRLPITVVVFNDSTLSLIKLKQRPQHGGNAVTYRRTDFAAVAEAMGVPALRVHSASEVDAAVRANEGPSLIDAIIDPAEYQHILAAIRGPRS